MATDRDDILQQKTRDQEEWNYEQKGYWHSVSRTKPLDEAQLDVTHRALFERVEASISFGFASIQRALVDLQLQLQFKLRQLKEQQELILQTSVPDPNSNAYQEFQENVKKIDRSLESFTAHADNLSHIKLTLARAAAFVSPEGNLAQLVKVLIFFFVCCISCFFLAQARCISIVYTI